MQHSVSSVTDYDIFFLLLLYQHWIALAGFFGLAPYLIGKFEVVLSRSVMVACFVMASPLSLEVFWVPSLDLVLSLLSF